VAGVARGTRVRSQRAPVLPPSGPRRSHPSGYQRAVAQRTAQRVGRRRAVNSIMISLTYLAAIIATLPLVFIFGYMLYRGASSLSLDFFTKIPAPAGEAGGGMANGIIGTLILIGIASAVGLPVGMGAGLYLAEKRSTPLATLVRFLSDVLNGLPSIVVGIFAWQLLVAPFGGYSALAGGIALGAMMIPLVTRTTEEMVRVVPASLREAALALGYPRWRTSLTIVLRTATAGIVTGVLVAIARIAGETAPLLFTSFGNSFFSVALDKPIDALSHQIYVFSKQPFDQSIQNAWAGSLVLIGMILIISLIARFVTRGRFVGTAD
jgi:phosphate transport system permease protein